MGDNCRICGELGHSGCIAALESQLAQYRWRRVEKEMPEENGAYLVRHRSRSYSEVITFHNGEWMHPRSYERLIQTHWMPLPPAPGEGE